MNPATQVFKEYPEQGYKWVELKKPGEEVQEGRKSLEDALEYEGNLMGHCVGGYCDDVLEGQKRVFSLRDSKGQPHVTVELQPSRSNTIRSIREGTATDFDIIQIKGSGKKDRAQRLRLKGTGYKDEPDAYLLPFVQDFVRSGQWGRVGDIQNTGLIDARVAGKPMPGRPAFMTEDEFKAYQAELDKGAAPREGFAEGGAVQRGMTPLEEVMRDRLLRGLLPAPFAEGGGVGPEATEPDVSDSGKLLASATPH
jgi:hypothetical protein